MESLPVHGHTLGIVAKEVFKVARRLGVPEELLAEYWEKKGQPWEMYTCGEHPDFIYAIEEACDSKESEKSTADGVVFGLWFTKKRFVVHIESYHLNSYPKPVTVACAERFLPQYVDNLKKLMETYYIAHIEWSHRWV